MDTERLGIELGKLICEMSDESIEEIDSKISALGGRMNHIFLEYIAFLLWTTSQLASNILPEKSFQHAVDIAFSETFDFLNAIEELRDHPEFTYEKYEKFTHYKFEQYYGALKDYPAGEGSVNARQNFSIVQCFIRCCFADMTEYRKFLTENNNAEIFEETSLLVVDHYNTFSDRVKSALSRF